MSTNEFMARLATRLVEEKKVSEGTLRNQMRILFQLNDKKPFKSLAFLRKRDDVKQKMSAYAESTQKSILAAICSALSLFKTVGAYKKTQEAWCGDLGESAKREDDKAKTHEPTETQRANWIDWSEVQSKQEELVAKASKLPKKLSAEDHKTLLDAVVLSLYTLFPPRRNQDYQRMDVIAKWTEETPKDRNYYDVKGKQFVFNTYKTAKQEGQQKFPVSKDLQDVIALWRKQYPTGPILRDAEGKELTAVNAVTRILNRIFGKSVGASMLRHSQLSHKQGDTLDEQKEDAEAMAHDIGTQRDQVKNV